MIPKISYNVYVSNLNNRQNRPKSINFCSVVDPIDTEKLITNFSNLLGYEGKNIESLGNDVLPLLMRPGTSKENMIKIIKEFITVHCGKEDASNELSLLEASEISGQKVYEIFHGVYENYFSSIF